MNVLFVCTGNICRSPMAEAIARSLASRPAFGSAGLHALDGSSASPNAVVAAAAFDGDAGEHLARQLDGDIAGWADRIYVMTAEHLAAMRRWFPHVGNITELLDPSGADVPDPYGSEITTYLTVAGQITMAIEARAGEWGSD